MLSFKLRYYHALNGRINELQTILNATPVAPELAPYIDGIPAEQIQPEQTLQQQKEDKAQALPGAKEFRKAGVDLTLTIPNCPVSGPQLNAITATVTTFQPQHMGTASRFISYNQKANQWAVNPAGNKALADAITTLSGPQEKTYTLTVQLFEHIAQHSPDLLTQLFPEGREGARGEALNHEWLVTKIRSYGPRK